MMKGLFTSGLSMMFWDAESIGELIKNFLFNICIFIDGIVYNLIDVCYQVFLVLARAQIFDQNAFGDIMQRFYVLVGVLMMFFVAYSLLKVVANPDDLSKGDMAPGKLIKNILTSIILLTLLPTIFRYTYQIQNVLLDQDLIGRIVFGQSATESANTIKEGGRQMAVQVWSAFFYAENGDDASVVGEDGETLADAKNSYVEEGKFRRFMQFSTNAAEGDVNYTVIIAFGAGLFCLWMIASFVFDLGIRAVKLGVLQIIAPIPILMRVLPSKGKTFNNWVQMTLATFFEVFVRIFIVYIVAEVAGMIPDVIGRIDMSTTGGGTPWVIAKIAQAMLIMGVIAYAKQAPKMIGELLGIKSGNMKLGLRDKLQAGGGMIGAAAIGGGVTTGIRNIASGVQNVGSQGTTKGKVWTGIGIIPSALAGAASGAVRGGFAARSAKTYADVANAARTGAAGATKARDYRDDHPMFERDKNGNLHFKRDADGNITGGTIGAHMRNAGRSISAWATGQTTENVKKKRDDMAAIQGKVDSAMSTIKSDFESKGDNVIVREKDGSIRRDKKTDDVITLGALKRNLDAKQEEYKKLSKNEWVNEKMNEFRALNVDTPSAAELAAARARYEGDFDTMRNNLGNEVRELTKDYNDAMDDAVKNQFLFENTNKKDFAVKFKEFDTKSGHLEADWDTYQTVNGVSQAIKDYAKLVDDNKVTIERDVNSIMADLQKAYKTETNDVVKKDLEQRFENMQKILKNMKNPKADKVEFIGLDGNPQTIEKDLGAKSLKGAYGAYINEIEDVLRKRKQQEEKDKKK